MTQSNEHPSFLISQWGGERFPLEFQVEPEFGFDGYQGILAAELAVLDKLIKKKRIGKEGEFHAKLILEPPEACPAKKAPATGDLLKTRPQWEQRYARKESFSKLIARFFYKACRLLPTSVKKQRAHSLLAPYFEEANYFLCLEESFWLKNKKFVSNFFPKKKQTVISDIEIQHELSSALRVPLQRLMTSLEGLVLSQNVCNIDNFILVIDGHRFDKAMTILRGTLPPRQRVLLISNFPGNNLVENWESISQINEKWWLLEGPPAALLRSKASYHAPSPTPHTPPPSPQGWPKISVIVVSYNQADYLGDCLHSILGQRYPNLECIVVDGDSTDGSKAILEEYRGQLAHLIIEPDRCQSDALNKGFCLATGEVMTWVCSDDLLEEGALLRVARAFAENKVDIVAGGCRIIDAHGENLVHYHNGFPFGKKVALSFGDLLSFQGIWELGMYFYQPEIFFSRQIWEASGGYIKEHLHFAMDYDLFLRFAMAGASVIHIPEFLATRRIHESQKTQHTTMSYLPTIRNLLKEYKCLIEKAITSTTSEASE